ncbi:MAG: glycine C-acetyltransferase [Pirellulales bacterium]|nr:glycine C-acetyltransferase [Pirellulales bacterium]
MPNRIFEQRTSQLLAEIHASGRQKAFYHITGPMGPEVEIAGRGRVLVLCSNNYLGLANHPEVIEAGMEGLRRYGGGTASVRFICGTLQCHREIEAAIAAFAGTETALTYVSCWNANEALMPTVAGDNDVLISDELNHASIIDGCRLAGKKTARAIFRHSDMDDLRAKLAEHADKECRWIITDGVFSMEGDVARLQDLVAISKESDAMLIVDDSHGVGVLGEHGRGTPEYSGVFGAIDVVTGTLGKALGGAAGGYVAARRHVIELLEQRSRPALFSNALPATVAHSAKKAIEIVEREPERVARLHANVQAIRDGLARLGFDCPPSPTAIIPIMIGDAADANAKSGRLMELGVMVIGFGFPVVPQGKARLRVQVSAALEPHHIERALDAFGKL